MAAIVTDQFRILNANNFVETVENSANSYYVFLGLPNPSIVGFGRTTTWDTNLPNPVDSFDNLDHVGDTTIFGKKVTSVNVRRLIKRINWTAGTRYEMYRHDYSITNQSAITKSARLYDANYYVMNKNFQVYICIENGSSGISTTGNASQDEPLFTDLEPSRAGESGDGYIWKYLFTVPPSDIIKFDSTSYISVPNDWSSSIDAPVQSVRENGDSTLNNNQIKTVYIDEQGFGYSGGLGQELNILGDGSGAKVVVDVVSGKITKTIVSAGGQGYTYGQVDLGPINQNIANNAQGKFAKLIPIIPPSKGHGYDLYKELGTDKILVYARFDDSTKDFPIDTKFAQIGIVKNPTSIGSTSVFTENQFSSLNAFKFSSTSGNIPTVGVEINQTVTGGIAKGYTASYDPDTMVLKYWSDRSLFYNDATSDSTDFAGITTMSTVVPFESSSNAITSPGGFSGSIDTNFSGITTNPTGNKLISLDTQFSAGLASPEINKGSGEIVYLNNRSVISRNSRQKEDIKIILEF